MTYCVAMSLDAGMIFASDSRTNAGVDQIARFSKMRVFSREEDRVIVEEACYEQRAAITKFAPNGFGPRVVTPCPQVDSQGAGRGRGS